MQILWYRLGLNLLDLIGYSTFKSCLQDTQLITSFFYNLVMFPIQNFLHVDDGSNFSNGIPPAFNSVNWMWLFIFDVALGIHRTCNYICRRNIQYKSEINQYSQFKIISNVWTWTLLEKVYETHSHSTPSKICSYLVAFPSWVKQPIFDWNELTLIAIGCINQLFLCDTERKINITST